MDTKKLTDSLDDRLFSDKIFKKVYVFYAFWLVVSPVVETICQTVGLKFIVMFQIMLIATLFAITKFFELIFNFRNINIKNKTIIDLLLVCLFVWFLISSAVNSAFNVNFFLGICYFLCFVLFVSIDKRFYKTLAIVFVCEMVFNTILGLIDLENNIVPGFEENEFEMSMQFRNPNWAGFVVIIAEILCLWFIYDSEKSLQKASYFLAFIVLTIGLFVGGSFAPEMSFYLCELALLIYLWIKNKKCPWLILSAFLTSIFISFAVWFVPVFRRVSTANANFFYETLAMIDGKLGTNLVEGVSTFFDKLFGWGVMTEVPGSDGWGRGDLNAQAYKAIFASAKSFIFGYGSAYIYTIRVHNCFLVMWLEFGIVGILLFLAIIAMLLVRFVKIKKTDCIVFLFSALVMLLFDSLFCCIEPYCFPFFVIFSAIIYKQLYSKELKEAKQKQEILSQK